MKKKVAEFAARLKQAKERTLLDQPRQRKPTKKALQLQRKEDSEEEEITKQPVQNAKPNPKKKESEAEKGKENAGEKEKAVPIESKDTEKAKPKKTNKRKATTDKDKSEKQVTKAKKSLSNDAKFAASKETAMRLFNCSENDEAEVTNVDKENHDVEELVLTNVQSTGNRLSKKNGGMFRDMVNKKYPEFSVGLENAAQPVSQRPLQTMQTSQLQPPAHAQSMSHLQTNPVPSQSHLQRPDHTISAETTTTLIRPGLVSQIVGALKTVNGTACNGYDVTMFDDNDDYHIEQEQNTNVNRPFCAEENDQCLKCKPIIEKLKQEIKELRSSQIPGELPYLVMFL